jgi:hypothetical protein
MLEDLFSDTALTLTALILTLPAVILIPLLTILINLFVIWSQVLHHVFSKVLCSELVQLVKLFARLL